MRRVLLLCLLVLAGNGCSLTARPPEGEVRTGGRSDLSVVLPLRQGSQRFAVIGDCGSGGPAEYEIGAEMADWRAKFPFELVIMLGDNIYGSDTPADYKLKFEDPFKALLDAGVKFHACLGNHDNNNQRFYKRFNMGGNRYHTFKGSTGSVRFFALDSNYIDKEQLDWLEKELAASGSDWKICYFHHPLYSSGRFHGPSVDKREVLEPILIKHKVNVVFSGHEHFYERIKPQNGIYYFISGAAGNLRFKNIDTSAITDKAFDRDFSFMLVEIAGDEMHFQVVSRVGKTVDSGVIHHGRPQAGVDEVGDSSRFLRKGR